MKVTNQMTKTRKIFQVGLIYLHKPFKEELFLGLVAEI